VALPISETADPLRAPRGHSSGHSLAGLLAHLLAVRRPVLLEILSVDHSINQTKQKISYVISVITLWLKSIYQREAARFDAENRLCIDINVMHDA
jgi:hypothetical protein